MVNTFEIFLGASITVLSLGLLILSLIGYYKKRNPKMLFVTGVFIIILIKGLLFSINLFFNNINFFESLANIWIFDLLILILLYTASLKG